METAASGLPVVASDVGCRQVVGDGWTGTLVAAGDPDERRRRSSTWSARPIGVPRSASVRSTRPDKRSNQREVVRRVLVAYADVAQRRHIVLDTD